MNTIRLNVLGAAKAASSGVSIKNQDKSVDITENGVTELTADSGYTGLGKVTINANVQGGGASSGGNMAYLDVSGLDDMGKISVLSFLGMLMKFETGGVLVITPCGASVQYNASAVLSGVKAVAYMPSLEIDMGASGKGTMESFREKMLGMGISPVSITEEEFYTL